METYQRIEPSAQQKFEINILLEVRNDPDLIIHYLRFKEKFKELYNLNDQEVTKKIYELDSIYSSLFDAAILQSFKLGQLSM